MTPEEFREIEANAGSTGWVAGGCAIVIVLLFLSGLMTILAGVIAGVAIVLGLIMTVEQVPGFWAFATTGVGKVAVLIGTAWLTHYMFGTSTIIGMIAMCTSLILKVLVIESKQIELGKRATFSFLEAE